MDIDRALRNMDRTTRELVKKYVEAYYRTGNVSYAREALSILENYDDDPDVKELVRVLKR